MAKRIKLKARTKSHCDHSHYLELCQSLDGDNYTYLRYCTKCGQWWTCSTQFVYAQEREEVTCYCLDGTKRTLYVLPSIIQKHETIIFDDGRGHRDTYKMNADGTIGEIIRKEFFNGNN